MIISSIFQESFKMIIFSRELLKSKYKLPLVHFVTDALFCSRICASDGAVHRSYLVICDKCIRSTKQCGKCGQPLNSACQASSNSFSAPLSTPDDAPSVEVTATSKPVPPLYVHHLILSFFLLFFSHVRTHAN